jgi:glycosyltransferase involved in cell wall biosynthesis
MRGVAICTYNRAKHLGLIIGKVLTSVPEDTRIVVCDDGSTDDTFEVVRQFPVKYFRGPNLGVAANKNRALYLLQDCDYIAILEDDLYPTQMNWFETYENTAIYTGIHHFCRVQEKRIDETIPEFTEDLQSRGVTPIYGPSVIS